MTKIIKVKNCRECPLLWKDSAPDCNNQYGNYFCLGAEPSFRIVETFKVIHWDDKTLKKYPGHRCPLRNDDITVSLTKK